MLHVDPCAECQRLRHHPKESPADHGIAMLFMSGCGDGNDTRNDTPKIPGIIPNIRVLEHFTILYLCGMELRHACSCHCASDSSSDADYLAAFLWLITQSMLFGDGPHRLHWTLWLAWDRYATHTEASTNRGAGDCQDGWGHSLIDKPQRCYQSHVNGHPTWFLDVSKQLVQCSQNRLRVANGSEQVQQVTTIRDI